MSVPKFPKPEKGVERYEVWGWFYAPLNEYDAMFQETTKRDAVRSMLKCTDDGYPAYIYDRRTGKVIATNEGELGR